MQTFVPTERERDSMYLKVFPKQKKADYRILEAPEDLSLGELHQ